MSRVLYVTTLMLITICFLPVNGNSQTSDKTPDVYVYYHRPTLLQLRQVITAQTGYEFSFSDYNMDHQRKIRLPSKKMTVLALVKLIAREFDVDYIIEDKLIVFIKKEKQQVAAIDYQGTVTNEKNKPLSDVRVVDSSVLNSIQKTNDKGRFCFPYPVLGKKLHFYLKEYEPTHIEVVTEEPILLKMYRQKKDSLDAVQVSALNPGNNRNTSAAYSIDPKDLSEAYNANLLNYLQRRVVGMLYTEANGAPGSTGKPTIRGNPTIGLIPGAGNLPANAPLILINGVPWANSCLSMAKLGSMAGNPDETGFQTGLSPFNNISVEDIESIQVYVGADATALFGSRGTHGVISIQTKKGKAGNGVTYNLHATQGMAISGYRLPMMNTSEYTDMRREGITNDGRQVDEITAPELFRWQQDRSTDWFWYLVGNTARIHQYYASASGELGKTLSFYIGGGIREERSVLPLDRPTQRGSIHLNLNYNKGKRASMQVSLLMNSSRYRMPAMNPMPLTGLSPNAPYPFDAKGNLVFEENGLAFTNIYAQLKNGYMASMFSILGSMDYRYSIKERLTVNGKLGINYNSLREEVRFLNSSYAPNSGMTGRMESALSKSMSLTMDAFLQYTDTLKNKRNLILTTGINLQRQTDSWNKTELDGYTDDLQIGNPAAASFTNETGGKTQYHYIGMYAAAYLSFRNRYSLNLIARYDGSSRFAPGKQFGLFGAAGGSWTFSGNQWIRKLVNKPWIGKLKASFSTTGSDQTGNNSFQDTYRRVTDGSSYGGIIPLRLEQVANPSLSWEKNLKKELALDLKFNILLSVTVAWYHTVTSSQFISTIAPSQNGFPQLQIINHDAAVQNSGFEIALGFTRSLGKQKTFTTQLTTSVPRNKLIRFKDLANSLYSQTLIIGQPLSVQPGFLYNGVNSTTGYYQFKNAAGTAAITRPEDLVPTGHLDPVLFGGFYNELQWKQWSLDFFMDFKVQKLNNPKLQAYQRSPGSFQPDMLNNQPKLFLERWREPGDIASNQRFSAYPGADYILATRNFMSSSAGLVNGSYARLRDLRISYDLSGGLLNKLHLQKMRVYLRAENLFTITSYKYGDPTILKPQTIPSTKSFIMGIQASL